MILKLDFFTEGSGLILTDAQETQVVLFRD